MTFLFRGSSGLFKQTCRNFIQTAGAQTKPTATTPAKKTGPLLACAYPEGDAAAELSARARPRPPLAAQETSTKQKDTTALLQKIIDFKPLVDNTIRNFLPANALVTAWAYDKMKMHNKAIEWLDKEINLY